MEQYALFVVFIIVCTYIAYTIQKFGEIDKKLKSIERTMYEVRNNVSNVNITCYGISKKCKDFYYELKELKTTIKNECCRKIDTYM